MTEDNGTEVFVPGRGRCQILRYEGNGFYTVITKTDQQLFLPRTRFRFTKKG